MGQLHTQVSDNTCLQIHNEFNKSPTHKKETYTVLSIKSSMKKESQDHIRFFGANNCRDPEQFFVLV
jgi:hypothetical protein